MGRYFVRVGRLCGGRISGESAERGQVLPLIAVFMLVVIAFAGLVIDVGNVYRVQQALQASTDAAAAAGAGQLTLQYPPNTANAISQAKNFSSSTGGRNPITGVPATGVTVTVATSCVGSNSNLPVQQRQHRQRQPVRVCAHLFPRACLGLTRSTSPPTPRHARRVTRCRWISSWWLTAPDRCRPAVAPPTARTSGKTCSKACSKGSSPASTQVID